MTLDSLSNHAKHHKAVQDDDPKPRPRAAAPSSTGLLGGLGFGVLFVALGQIPETAGTLSLALHQLTGAFVTIAVATAVQLTWQPSRAAAGWGVTSGLLGVSGSLAFVEASHLADSPWSPCLPRSTPPSPCCWPGPCSASASAPGSASAWSSARRPPADRRRRPR